MIEPKLVMKLVNFKPSKIHEKDVSGGSEEKLRKYSAIGVEAMTSWFSGLSPTSLLYLNG